MLELMKLIIVFLLISTISFGVSSAQTKTKEQLQAELTALEQQIAEQKAAVESKQKEAATLQRDVTVLDTKIKKSENEIKARDKSISLITYDIADKEKSISALDNKIDIQKGNITETLKQIESKGSFSTILATLSSNSFSDILLESKNFNDLKNSLNKALNEIKNNRVALVVAKEDLEDSKNQEQALKQQQVLIKKDIESDKKEKSTLLTVTKGQEKNYTAQLKETEKRAAAIRAALFELNGSAAINFGRAYDLAKQVEKVTGVRPAFLLGIITVETNLGQNIGTGNWKTDMHPTRDQPIFEKICAKLGLNPDTQPVSKKAWYGYGGAMGPAQFIPSTWVMYEDRVSKLTGNSPANPWNPLDAFMASGLLLADSGAAKQTRAAEQRAAVCYLAGCGNANKAAYQFYGTDALKYADKYEANIKVLQGQ